MKAHFPVALTFDIDWAPDFTVAECAEILSKFSIPATFFATHSSPILKELSSEKLFEIGIHPNFLDRSSHGSNEREVLNTMLEIVPDATMMRTHGLFQSTNLFFLILKEFPQIKMDFSLFLPENNRCNPFKFYNEHQSYLIRIPFQWEDDIFFMNKPEKKSLGNLLIASANYQIYNFHPLHIYLNSTDSSLYGAMKKWLKKPLSSCEEGDLNAFKNNSIGAKNWLTYIIDSIEHNRFVRASQIASIQDLNIDDHGNVIGLSKDNILHAKSKF